MASTHCDRFDFYRDAPERIVDPLYFMKQLLSLLFLLTGSLLMAQEAVNPAIKSFGTVSTVPNADVTPDPSRTYNIVVDVMSGGDDHSEVFFSMNNVARLVNLHTMAGVPQENLNVVVAVHNAAMWSVLSNEEHQKRFKTTNPHEPLIEELLNYGVKIVVCGQSLVKRNVSKAELLPGVEVATSALTVLTEYQLMGYALLRF